MTTTYTRASDLFLAALTATSEAARASERFAHGIDNDNDYAVVETAQDKAQQAQQAVFEVLLDLTCPRLADVDIEVPS